MKMKFPFSFYSVFFYSVFSNGIRITNPIRFSFPQISIFKQLENRVDVKQEPNELSEKYKMSPIWNAPKVVWSFAWKLQATMLPILHYFDNCVKRDTFVNLSVLWWKAIAGNNRHSPTYDGGIAYDFLPPFMRWVVSYPLCLLYPKLHHQNVALRTVYLDDILKTQLNQSLTSSSSSFSGNLNTRAHILSLGSGFDTRSIRFALKYNRTTWHEFDLQHVIDQKLAVLQRFLERRKLDSSKLPQLYSIDMNDPLTVVSAIKKALNNVSIKQNDHIIFITEASLLYLNKSVVAPLLETSFKTASQFVDQSNIQYCFADRFPLPCCTSDNHVYNYNITEEYKEAQAYMNKIGLQINQWQIKPGRARHMGVISSI